MENAVFDNGLQCIFNNAAYDGTQWIAGGLGTNQLATSVDGITWSTTTNGNTIFNNRVQSIAVKENI